MTYCCVCDSRNPMLYNLEQDYLDDRMHWMQRDETLAIEDDG